MKRKIIGIGLLFLLIFNACSGLGPCGNEEIKEYVREILINNMAIAMMTSDTEDIRDFLERRVEFTEPRLVDFEFSDGNIWYCSVTLIYDPVKDIWDRLSPEQRIIVQKNSKKNITIAQEIKIFYSIKKMPNGKFSIRIQNAEEVAAWMLQMDLIRAMLIKMVEADETE